MLRRIITWGLVGALVLFAIYSLYDRLMLAKVLKSYEETFQGLEHPKDTTLIDTFKFRFSYYPATYRDESIQSQCAYLVGEIRSYTSDWINLTAFYKDKALIYESTDDMHVGIFPIQLASKTGASPWFDMEGDFPYSPFDVDVLARLESHYYFWGFPKGLNESGKKSYAIYIAPECE